MIICWLVSTVEDIQICTISVRDTEFKCALRNANAHITIVADVFFYKNIQTIRESVASIDRIQRRGYTCGDNNDDDDGIAVVIRILLLLAITSKTTISTG